MCSPYCHTATIRFQKKIDVVKDEVKGPCADFLGTEIKYKILKKDITKAKRAREKEAEEEQGEEGQDATGDKDHQETDPKPRRKRGKTNPESVSKPKTVISKKKDPASKKRKRA